MIFDISKDTPTTPTSRSWQMGIGNDHATRLLRKDVFDSIKTVQEKIGFRYIRFHGIFSDDMSILQRLSDLPTLEKIPYADRIQYLNFNNVAKVYDNVLELGLKPFVELSFMPNALAKGNTQALRYPSNNTLPADREKWKWFIKEFIKFLLARYGEEEVESWYFEVWNEPDFHIFFAGTQEEYFDFYGDTATAIKEVNPRLKVGGPSTSGCKWIENFVSFCEKNKIPYDFVSTHHYPGDAFGNDIELFDPKKIVATIEKCGKEGSALDETMEKIFFSPEKLKAFSKGIFRDMDRKLRANVPMDKPIFITEWNSTAMFGIPLHDEKYSAAFVIKSVTDSENVLDGNMFWCCSDIFEEIFDFQKPFHGSYGIISERGIPKPNFWAFWILNQLYPNRLNLPITDDKVEISAYKQGNKMQLLVVAQNPDYMAKEVCPVKINLDFSVVKYEKIAIDDNHCNPKKIWEELGSPSVLTKEQTEYIKTHSAPQKELVIYPSPTSSIELELKSNDIILLNLEY